MNPLRIATRGSALARWQADHVADLLRSAHAGLTVHIVEVSTEGDRRTEVPLAEIGGKGVFAKEVQAAVLDGRADLAVHSAKDLPAVTPSGLRIVAVPERGDARDALVGSTFAGLHDSATVATGSARRRVQLAALRPDLRFAELRGNMATRLDKAAGFDAIVVAAVALQRLGLGGRIAEVIDESTMVPQVGQGALAVECRDDDVAVNELLAVLDHGPSRRVVDCERAFLAELGGDCSLPAGAHAVIGAGGRLSIRGVLSASTDPAEGPPETAVLDAPAALADGDRANPDRANRDSGPDRDSGTRLGRDLARLLRGRVEGSSPRP